MPDQQTHAPRSERAMHRAAAARDRIRITGAVVERGITYGGRYRQVWLLIDTSTGRVRVTAGQRGTLGSLPTVTVLTLEARLTGVLHLANQYYEGERARLVSVES